MPAPIPDRSSSHWSLRLCDIRPLRIGLRATGIRAGFQHLGRGFALIGTLTSDSLAHRAHTGPHRPRDVVPTATFAGRPRCPAATSQPSETGYLLTRGDLSRVSLTIVNRPIRRVAG
jgi:hypothetical protein